MMATDLEKLLVRVEANLGQFEKEMAKANKISTRELRAIEGGALRAASRVESAMGKIGSSFKAFGAGAIAGFGVERIATAARDVIKSIADIGDNAKKLGLSNSEFQELSFIATQAGVETASLASGMKRLAVNTSEAARGQGELGALFQANGVSIRDTNGNLLSQTEILKQVAELVKNAASEQDAAAIAQIAMGKVGIDNLNLLADGAAGVEKAMADAARSNIKLTDEQIGKMQEYDDKIEEVTAQISAGLKGAFADALPSVESFVDASIKEFQDLAAVVASVQSLIASVSIAQTSANPRGFTPPQPPSTQAAQIPLTPANSEGKGDRLPAPIAVPKRATVIPPQSTITPRASRGATSRTASRSNNSASGPNDFERAKQNLTEAIALLNVEQAAMAANVGTLDGYENAVERAATSQRLVNEAKSAGLKITPELMESINGLAGAYVTAQVNIDALAEKQEQFLEGVNEFKSLSKDVLSGFIDDLVSSKDPIDAMLNGIGKIADKLLSIALDGLVESAFGALLGGGSGGGFGSLIGSLFGGFREKGGPVSPGKSYVVGEKRPEIFEPSTSGRIIPSIGTSTNGAKNITIKVDVSGARGDRDIMAMVNTSVQAGVSKAISGESSRSLERSIRG